MDITPAIRTAPSASPRVDYGRYLQTAEWRQRRDAKLRSVRWQCERCPARRNLQVHHKTYERLGREWLTDLEVLCRDCHEGEHVRQMHDDPTGRVYLRLAREVLKDRAWECFADLVEEMKLHCAMLKLPYDAHQVDKALGLLTGETTFSKVPRTNAERVQAFHDGRPFTDSECRALVKRLFGGVPDRIARPFPEPRGENPRAVDIYAPVYEEAVDHDRY